MRRVDAAVLAGVTRGAHWVQRRTQRTCYWLAQQAAAFAAVWIAVEAVRSTWWMVLLLLPWLSILWAAADADKRFHADPSRLPVMDSVKDVSREGRMFLLLINLMQVLLLAASLTFERVWGSAVNVATLLHAYLMAVTPLPPGTERVRDKVRGTLIPMEVRR